MAGAECDRSIILTSRIRLARNLSSEPFPGWAQKKGRVATFQKLIAPTLELPQMKNAFAKQFNELTSVEKQVLVERHLISREQAARSNGSGVVINRSQSLSIMLNEEDHLRIQSIFPGLQLNAAYQLINEVDNLLEAQLPFAFDPTLGYLTACPTNLGTGMRASVMMHLPGLVISEQIEQVVAAINKLGLAVRGLYGEGTETLGNLFQISNQATLGDSEPSIVEALERVIRQVISHENNARLKIIEDQPAKIYDRIGRSYGMLKFSHIIASKEALELLSMLRLGADLKFFPKTVIDTCDALLMAIQPAHLQHTAKRKLATTTRDELRAKIIREQLQSIEPPDIHN